MHAYTHDLDTFFHSHIIKPYFSWLQSAEHAIIEIYSTLHRRITKRVNSHTSTFDSPHLKQTTFNTFVIHTNILSTKHVT